MEETQIEINLRVPVLRFLEFDGDWALKTIEAVANIGRGKSKHRPRNAAFLYGGCYPFVQTADIRSSDLYLTKYTQTYSEAGLKQSKLWHEDTLCVTIAANIAETAILKIKACFPDSIIGILPKVGQTEVLFLKYQFDKFKLAIQNLSQGVAQSNLNQEKLGKIHFAFPSLPEQQKIASFLSAVDEKIQLLTRKKELLEQYKKGVMQPLFSGKLRFKDEEGNDYPEWEEKKLQEIAERVTRKNTKGNTNVLTISAQEGLISQLEYFNRTIAGKDLSRYYLLERNEFAYNKSYSQGYPMGAIKRLKKYESGIVSTLYICFRFHSALSLEFLEQYFEYGLQNSEIEKVAQEGARNHGLLNIGVNDFFKISLRIPCLEEQEKIAEFLSAIDQRITIVEEQTIKTQTFKKGLLQQMFV